MKPQDPSESQRGVDTSVVILVLTVIVGTLLGYYDVVKF